MLKTIEAEALKFYYDVKRYLFNYLVGIVSTTIFLSCIYFWTQVTVCPRRRRDRFCGIAFMALFFLCNIWFNRYFSGGTISWYIGKDISDKISLYFNSCFKTDS